MKGFIRVLLLVLLLSTAGISGMCSGLVSALAGPPPAPIFPPASQFMLVGAGGAISITQLSPQALAGPVKPLTRTEYDIAGTALNYRVSVFHTTNDETS